MRGFTQVLKASAVIPNHAYRIRLAIEMLMTQMTLPFFFEFWQLTTNIDLGPDQNICDGKHFEIKTGTN
jgi:hypothetical protein